MKISKKAGMLLQTFKTVNDELNQTLCLKDVVFENIGEGDFTFSVDDEHVTSYVRVIPYKDNSTRAYENYATVHYLNKLLESTILSETNLKKFVKSFKTEEFDEHLSKYIDNLTTELNSEIVREHYPLSKSPNKKTMYKPSLKMLMGIHMAIELEYEKGFCHMKPILAFEENTLLTKTDKAVAFMFRKIFTEKVKHKSVKLENYNVFKELMLTYVEMFKIFDSYGELGEDVNEVLTKYINVFDKVKTLVNNNSAFPTQIKKELRINYDVNIRNIKSDSMEHHRLNKDVLENVPKEDEMTFIEDDDMEELEFKKMVRDNLTKYKFEPFRIVGMKNIDYNMWLREVVIEMKKELEELDVEPFMSIKMTLGEIVPEEIYGEMANKSNTQQSSTPVVAAPLLLNGQQTMSNAGGMFAMPNGGQGGLLINPVAPAPAPTPNNSSVVFT